MKQIHSGWVIPVSKNAVTQEADGMITEDKSIALGMVSADCLPVLFYDPKAKLIALTHAGWKGMVAGIITETVAVLCKSGASTSDILVGIGPSIRSCCYTVESERTMAFKKIFSKRTLMKGIRKNGGIWSISLQAVVKEELQRCGIAEYNIEDLGICTACSDEYFSFRRSSDKENFDEFLSFIALV